MNNKKQNSKSISELIKGPMLTIIVTAFSIVALLSVVIQFISIQQIINYTVASESTISTERIEWAIKSYKNIAEDIGTTPEMSDPNVSVARKVAFLQAKSKEYGLVRCKTINPDGYSDMDGKYRGDREYFKHAINGETYLSDPIIAKTDGQLALIVAAPLWKDGVYGSEVTGVVFCSINPELLSDIVSHIQTKTNTTLRVINSEGTIVASQDLDEVKHQINYIKRAESDSYFEDFAQIDRAAVRGETGLLTSWDGIYANLYAINEIQGTPGWKYILNVSLKDYLQHFWLSVAVFLILTVVLVVVINKRSEKIAQKVGAPFRDIADRLKKAADGDLSSEVLTFGDTEETRTISSAARDLVKRLEFMVMDNEEFNEGIALQDFIDQKTLNTFQDMVMASTGLGIVVINSDGETVSTPIDSCDFCGKYVKQSKVGAERCKNNDVNACMKCIEKGACVSYECHMGIRGYAAPIMLEGHYIGAILGGQIRLNEEVDVEFLSKQAEEMGIDKMGLISAATNMRVWSKEEVDRVEGVLNSTAEFLSDMVQRAHKQNIKNRKQEKSAMLKSVKTGFHEKNISSFMDKMTGYDAMNLFSTDASSVVRNLSIQDDEERLSETSYDVREMVNEAIGDMSLRTRGKSIDFLLDIKDELPRKLMGDQNKISNIISRMIQTAISSTDAGYIRTDVSGVKSGYALYLKIKVRYSGGNKEAIEASDMRKFVDSKNSFSVNNHSSSEISLITLGNAIKEMNGQIDIKENSGHGITMCVVIPQLEDLVER